MHSATVEAVEPWIVDIHSHLVPSGDDGVQTIEEGIALLQQAAAHGTKVVYATPHIHARWDSYPLTAGRLARYDSAFPVMQARCASFGLELRRGFELFPGALPEGMTVTDAALADSGCVLIEFPGDWCFGFVDEPCQAVWDQAVEAVEAGLLPVLAHPERCAEIWDDPDRVAPFVEQGWPLALNALSLIGQHQPAATRTVWRLLEQGYGDLVASDSHGYHKPPELDDAYRLLEGAFGEERARPMFDGSALVRADARV